MADFKVAYGLCVISATTGFIPHGQLQDVASTTQTMSVFIAYGAAHFWGNKRLIESAWALSGLGLGSGKKKM